MLALADLAGLAELVQERLSVPTGKGANAGLIVVSLVSLVSLVAGMLAGADSIDDMLRHGAMGRAVDHPGGIGLFGAAFRNTGVRHEVGSEAAAFDAGGGFAPRAAPLPSDCRGARLKQGCRSTATLGQRAMSAPTERRELARFMQRKGRRIL